METITSPRRGRPPKAMANDVASGEAKNDTHNDTGHGEAGISGVEAQAILKRQNQRRTISNMARMIAGESFLVRKC